MPQIFGTITVSDGISMGTEGMKYSLVSREVIADSIETVCNAQSMDGVLAIGGCDKNMPGAMIAIARLDIPAIFVYGGTIKPGHHDGRDLTIVSVFEAVGQYEAGKLSHAELDAIERDGVPRRRLLRRHVHRQHDVVGLRGPGDEPARARPPWPPRTPRRPRARPSRRRCWRRPSGPASRRERILTRKAFENAIAVVMALGGSTNAVLHLLAIAHAAGVPLALDDFEAIRARVPVLCDLKPSGRYVATDLHRAGGVPQVMKMLLDHGLLHGDALTDHREDGRRDPRRRARRAARRPGRDPALGDGRSTPRATSPSCAATSPRRARSRRSPASSTPVMTGPARVFESRGGLPRGDPRPADPRRATWS